MARPVSSRSSTKSRSRTNRLSTGYAVSRKLFSPAITPSRSSQRDCRHPSGVWERNSLMVAGSMPSTDRAPLLRKSRSVGIYHSHSFSEDSRGNEGSLSEDSFWNMHDPCIKMSPRQNGRKALSKALSGPPRLSRETEAGPLRGPHERSAGPREGSSASSPLRRQNFLYKKEDKSHSPFAAPFRSRAGRNTAFLPQQPLKTSENGTFLRKTSLCNKKHTVPFSS